MPSFFPPLAPVVFDRRIQIIREEGDAITRIVREELEVVTYSYTPVLTAATTDPTLGDGAIQFGRWHRIGSRIMAHTRLYLGTTGFNAGSGTYEVSLPVPMNASLTSTTAVVGWGHMNCNAHRYLLTAEYGSTNQTAYLSFDSGTTTELVTDSAPEAFAQNDGLVINFSYLGE